MLLILFLIGLIILYTINDRKLKNNNTNNNIQNDVKLYDDHIEITKPNKKIILFIKQNYKNYLLFIVLPSGLLNNTKPIISKTITTQSANC